MPTAVRYTSFGDIDVLTVEDVPRPEPGEGEVLVAVRAAGINPGEATIRAGVFAEQWPSTFPSGQGSDLAGVVVEGAGDWAPGDEVIGWVETRSSQAELAVVPTDQLVAKPASVSWEVGGALHVAGATAWAGTRALDPKPGEVVAVSGAAGGVGSLAIQLLAERGARVIGIASEANHDWLREHGAEPIAYGDGLAERLPALDAFFDTFGGGYVDLALRLGVPTERINTIIDFAAVQEHGVKTEGNAEGANVADTTALVERLADGRLELEIAATYPLADVRDAYRELERRHTRGKIVLIPPHAG